ncbi:MAG: class I SAM-dependent methyltransferase [Defluviitaleaceae bacterium]|nr:class I SAM-dependent methyltransferase [Defluviitaleaceae bacterium]
MQNYTEINAKVVDSWVEDGWIWGIPVSAEVCANARKGDWKVVLTPTIPVPSEWFPSLKGVKVLGLASGGGQQMPLFALQGAICTVMDYAEKQLESEKIISQREGYDIEIIKGDMTKPFPFEDGAFDLIFHPVSNCYIEDVHHVWRECARVLKSGGILLAGLDNGINYLFDNDEAGKPLTVDNTLPYNPLKNPALMKKLQKDNDGVQFSHTFDEQIGGQLKAGFVLTGAYEDFNDHVGGESELANRRIPSFWATRAVKTHYE